MTTDDSLAISKSMAHQPRLLIEAELRPVQGTRFAPTGFPNLGAAEYEAPSRDGRVRMLLVESPQSVANRLETLAWDEGANDLVAALSGLPYVKVHVNGASTDSIREAHRLNSPYIIGAMKERLAERAGIDLAKTKKKKSFGDSEAEGEDASTGVDQRRLASAVFYYDPNSVLHGVFLEKIVGLARLTRLLSGFIEASNAELAASGGVKNDRVDPSGKHFEGGAAAGYGNVPFNRSEYTAETIRAYFSFDDALLRSYGMPSSANRLLRALALWKIGSFLSEPRRLRSNCDFEVAKVTVTRPEGERLPELGGVETDLRGAIAACASEGLFAAPPVTSVDYVHAKSK
jgi:CRISPR-associated protein Csb1